MFRRSSNRRIQFLFEFLRVPRQHPPAFDLRFIRLPEKMELCYFPAMSAQEIIEQFKELPQTERAKVTKFVVENDDSWIPEEFKQGMEDAKAGRFVDMDTVLSGAKPPSRRHK